MNGVKLLQLQNNTWNNLTVCQQMNSCLFKDVIHKMCLQIIYIQYICIKRIRYLITYNGWYAIKPNQT